MLLELIKLNSRVMLAGLKLEQFSGGIKVAREAALHSVIIETDCLEVAELINNTKGSKTEIFWTISEI